MVLTPELEAAAVAQGKAVVSQAFSLLSSNLQTALAEGGVSNALPFCSVAALPLTGSVGQGAGLTLRRVSHKARNPVNQADAVETVVLAQFQGALASSNAPSPVVTNLLPGRVTFFAPIVLKDALCLKCHGQLGGEIEPENADLIRRLYPQDRATGFKLGELRGAWRVDLPPAQLKPGIPSSN